MVGWDEGHKDAAIIMGAALNQALIAGLKT